MASFVEKLIQTHGPQIAEQIATRLGVPADKAADVLPAVAPLILGGLQRQTEEPGGEDRLNQVVENEGDAGAFDDLAGFFSQQAQQNEGGLPDQAQGLSGAIPGLGGLGSLLGVGGTSQIAETLAEKVGIPKDKARQIVSMLGPVILGYLTKQRNQTGGSSLLAGLLDRDGDGNILDDVAGMLGVGGAFGSLPGTEAGEPGEKKQSPGGAGDMLGKALDSLLGGKN